ncbi:hypothetical protein ACF3NT_00600 [Naumannella halotolerans]|uniref:Bacterial repeat domain-containing protein n=1 Tax=Naumannella halotolerans TaxID=993414 RepID=A0A4R7J872_9ACTN|nr:hypothetical protein [Naumannella halotolerans]TDT32559.1 hypothetical protein CLV29_0139 [Naumannella halotolerans]
MGRGCVIAMQLGADGEPDPSTVEVLVSGVRATAIHSGPDGDLYFTDSANNSLVRLSPTPTAPEVEVAVTPQDWAVGDELSFAAEGLTGDGDALPESAYDWQVELVQCTDEAATDCSTSEATGVEIDGPVATVEGPDVPYYAYLQATVTVTDEGLSTSDSVEAHPRVSTVSLTTDPAGIEVSLGDTSGAAPQSARYLENGTVNLSVPQEASVDDADHEFSGWSDGDQAGTERTEQAPAGDSEYTAVYTEVPPPLETTVTEVEVNPTSIRMPFWSARLVVVEARVQSTQPVDRVTTVLSSNRGQRSISMGRISGSNTDRVYRSYVVISGTGASVRHTEVTALSGGQTVRTAGPDIRVSTCLLFC